MKTHYKIELNVTSGNDEFWEDVSKELDGGIHGLIELLDNIFDSNGIDVTMIPVEMTKKFIE